MLTSKVCLSNNYYLISYLLYTKKSSKRGICPVVRPIWYKDCHTTVIVHTRKISSLTSDRTLRTNSCLLIWESPWQLNLKCDILTFMSSDVWRELAPIIVTSVYRIYWTVIELLSQYEQAVTVLLRLAFPLRLLKSKGHTKLVSKFHTYQDTYNALTSLDNEAALAGCRDLGNFWCFLSVLSVFECQHTSIKHAPRWNLSW